jgi:hypothetical protein
MGIPLAMRRWDRRAPSTGSLLSGQQPHRSSPQLREVIDTVADLLPNRAAAKSEQRILHERSRMFKFSRTGFRIAVHKKRKTENYSESTIIVIDNFGR